MTENVTPEATSARVWGRRADRVLMGGKAATGLAAIVASAYGLNHATPQEPQVAADTVDRQPHGQYSYSISGKTANREYVAIEKVDKKIHTRGGPRPSQTTIRVGTAPIIIDNGAGGRDGSSGS
ncbi:hypothetical protein [Amycolatopsis sp. NPDC059657]|uniref:hypothetical protein n=1 Tax=Amycolatopsis sp. NPDC059657 TaxID=3346899 RepID=UPI00367284C5